MDILVLLKPDLLWTPCRYRPLRIILLPILCNRDKRKEHATSWSTAGTRFDTISDPDEMTMKQKRSGSDIPRLFWNKCILDEIFIKC